MTYGNGSDLGRSVAVASAPLGSSRVSDNRWVVFLYDRVVGDHEYRQRVRRHPPSSLLPVVAAASARYPMRDSWFDSPYGKFVPWALADIARVSLVYGGEHRGRPATERDLLACSAAYTAQGDPELTADSSGDAVANFMLRISSEQLVFQRDPFADIARTVAIFEQTVATRPPRVLTIGWPERLLGCQLHEYARAALLLQTSAWRNAGTFDPRWLNQSNFGQVLEELPRAAIEGVLARHFATDLHGFRQAQQRVPRSRDDRYRRFAHNPLRDTPVISGVGEALLVPVPALLTLKVSPLGLYYTGVGTEGFGLAFAQDAGDLFEAYVGRQFELLHGCTVHPSITYGKDKRESVDWIAVTDTAVLLIEVKATRPTESVRLGSPCASAALVKALGRAHEQVAATADRIRSRDPAFSAVPGDRPLVALIVTMEPFPTVNAPLGTLAFPDPTVATLICSAEEVEHLCSADVDPGALLLDHVTDLNRRGWSLSSALEGRPVARNAVLEKAFDRYRWLGKPALIDGQAPHP